jgi:hypothetical protein
MPDDQLPTAEARPLRLRTTSRWGSCQTDLPAKSTALYQPDGRSASCLVCADATTSPHPAVSRFPPRSWVPPAVPGAGLEQSTVMGQAGASAQMSVSAVGEGVQD